MPHRRLYLLSAVRLPTSYPLQIDADEVTAWLNGYLTLWHPAALWGAEQPPQPANSYDHDNPQPGAIYSIPLGPALFQPEDWRSRAAQAGAGVVEATVSRAATLQGVVEAARQAGTPPPLLELPPPTVQDFLSLGLGYLLLDTLYEAADHTRLLDGPAFWEGVCAAVQALLQGGDHRPPLRQAASKLREAREQLYPQRTFWVEFIHLPLPERGDWPAAFHKRFPVCVAGPATAFEQLAEGSPQRLAQLQERCRPDGPPSVELCCGAYCEREDAYLPVESQLWNLQAARTVLHRLCGGETHVYLRQHSAFHSQLPALLQHAGYRHAVLIAADGATLPRLYSTVIHWPAADGRAVDAFCREPLPADDPRTFFNLIYHLHQAYSSDAAPTIALKHQGRPACVFYDDFMALAELESVFGEWIPLSRYFTEASGGDYIGARPADEFFIDDLDRRVSQLRHPQAVSAFPQQWRWRRRLDGVFALAALYRSVTPHPTTDDHKLLQQLEDLERQGECDPAAAAATQEMLRELETAWTAKLAARLQGRTPPERPGWMLFNPCSFTRRIALELPDEPGPIPVEGPVKASEYADGVARVVVEVPSFGYAWFPRGRPDLPPPKPRLTLADGLTVRNEFFECDVDSTTGGIRSFRDLRRRVTRFGQQLVYNPGSRMVVQDIAVTHAGAALGEITSTGELRDEQDQVLARFRQRVRAWLGRPVLEIRIEWEDLRPPVGYPWYAYYAARFGWRDERAVLFRGVHGRNEQTGVTRPVSGDYLEVRLGAERSFLFTGGLPFLQRHGERMVDVILVPEGEEGRRFELLLAADRDIPMQTAQGWISSAPLVAAAGPPPSGPSGWLVHLDMPNVIVTSLRPFPLPAGSAADRAVALRYQETTGYGGTLAVRWARDPSRACWIDGTGQTLQPLIVEGDTVHAEFSGDELGRILVEWD